MWCMCAIGELFSLVHTCERGAIPRYSHMPQGAIVCGAHMLQASYSLWCAILGAIPCGTHKRQGSCPVWCTHATVELFHVGHKCTRGAIPCGEHMRQGSCPVWCTHATVELFHVGHTYDSGSIPSGAQMHQGSYSL